MATNISVAARNIAALRSMSTISARSLQNAQQNHPDHRVYSTQGMPFPCPANGIVSPLAFTDIDFRNTGPVDLPEGMVPMKRNSYPETRSEGPLGKSKWDFQYMKSGASIAVRVPVPRNSDLFDSEFKRIRNIGIRMWRYQKAKGYIDQGFLIQTSDEDISIKKLRNGDDVLAPHIVFWRIDGTRLDPNYQGN